jgi:hypothetical protein
MNYIILFSTLQDMQRGLFNHKQSAVKKNRYVYSFALLAKVVDAMRARLLADAVKRQSHNRDLREAYEKRCPDELRCS